MKIDLHCHTKKTKSCEDDSRNVSLSMFKKKVEEAEVKLLGITNHNYFDKKEYESFRESVKEFCYVMPGVELDVVGNQEKSRGHVILIANPEQVDLFSSKLNSLFTGSKPDDYHINSHDLYNNFKDMDIIYIAHFLKDKQLSENDLIDFESIMNKKNRLLREASNIVSIGVLQCNNHRAIIGTDVINWNEYEKCSFAELKFNIKDFRHLLRLIDRESLLINDLINESLNEKVIVYGNCEKKEYPFIIPIYDDVNIIFGDKGSGKTEILKSLKKYYELKGLKYTYFSGGDKQGWYDNKIKILDEDYSYIKLNLDKDYKKEISLISMFSDKNPTTVKNYYKYYKNMTSNNKRKKMKCLEIIKDYTFSNKIYKGLFNDIKQIDYFISKLDGFEYKKINEEEIDLLKDQLVKIKSNINENYKKLWIQENSKKLFNDFIDKMNYFVSQNTGNPSMPTETGLYSFIKNRMELNGKVNEILEVLDKTINSYESTIGKLGPKGEIKLTSNYCFINKKNYSQIDYKTLNKNKTELSNIIVNMDKINKNISSNKIQEYVELIKNNVEKIKLLSINDFISVSKKFTLNGKEYCPSKGELAILSLQDELISQKDSDIFIIDEPEANLSSTYINDEIVPLIKELAATKKALVIATHDANIAIRTRPSCSILKIVDNDKYKTYIGNMFTDELIELSEGDKLSWKEESIKYLEGGKEAFEERGELYE